MIETDRLVAPETKEETGERVFDKALRPVSLDEFVGQPNLHQQLEIFITAARNREEALDTCVVIW